MATPNKHHTEMSQGEISVRLDQLRSMIRTNWKRAKVSFQDQQSHYDFVSNLKTSVVDAGKRPTENELKICTRLYGQYNV